MQHTMTHQERVDLYVKIIEAKVKLPLTQFKVDYMRNASPGEKEMLALNEALGRLGWTN